MFSEDMRDWSLINPAVQVQTREHERAGTCNLKLDKEQKHNDDTKLSCAVLLRITGTRIYSKIDITKEHHQIPGEPDDVPKTAINAPFELFEYIKMPLCLRKATQTFQRFFDQVTRGLT